MTPAHLKKLTLAMYCKKWVYDGARYLVLFEGEKYDFIYSRIRYLIGIKTGITYVISHNYAKIKVDLYDSLSLEKS